LAIPLKNKIGTSRYAAGARGTNSSEEVSRTKSIETAEAEVRLLKVLPSDMVLRKSITIKANFDLRYCLHALRQQVSQSGTPASAGLWKFEMSSKVDGARDARDSSLGLSKRSLQGDMLWLQQAQSRVGQDSEGKRIGFEGGNADGDGVRSHVICWQEALTSLSSRFLAGTTPMFYVIGRQTTSFRAMFYHKAVSNEQNKECQDEGEGGGEQMTKECIIHRCTAGMYDDLKSMGIPLHILGASDSMKSGTNERDGGQHLDILHTARDNLNIFSTNIRRSKNNTTDKIIHLSDVIAIKAVIDCIFRVTLPIATTSYYRIAAELPTLLANTCFSHATPSQCRSSSLTCTAELGNESKTSVGDVSSSALDIDLESFCEDNLQNHDRIRSLHLTGEMSSSFIEKVAITLRKSGKQQSRRGDTRGVGEIRKEGIAGGRVGSATIENHFVNANIFKIDKNKLKTIDEFSSGYTVQNPFQLQTSKPEENATGLIDGAKKRLVLSHGEGNNEGGDIDIDDVDDDGISGAGNYFTLQLHSNLNDFSFSLAQTVDHLCAIPVVYSEDRSAMCCPVERGTVMTDIAWYEDDNCDSFEVSVVRMPELSARSIAYCDS